MTFDAVRRPDHFEELPPARHAGDDPQARRTAPLDPVAARANDKAFTANHIAISPDGLDDTDGHTDVDTTSDTDRGELQNPSGSALRTALGRSSIDGSLANPIDGEAKKSILDTFVAVETAIARLAFTQAERLQTTLDAHATEMSEAERVEAQRIIDGLQTTGRAHSANIPLKIANELGECSSSEGTDVEIEVDPDASFVSKHERDLLIPDGASDQEAKNRDNVLTRAKQVGARVRLAAMDMTPVSMKKRQEARTREAPVEKRPNAIYRFTAAFQKENHPVLQTVSCAYISNKALERNADARAMNYGQNVLTHPLTVTATFDGPSLTGLELTWPRKSRIRTTAAELGPDWEQALATEEETLLTTFIKKIDGRHDGASGLDGFINIEFGDQPVLSAGHDSRRLYIEPEKRLTKVVRAATLASAVDRVMEWMPGPSGMPTYSSVVSRYQYDPADDVFRGVNESGQTTSYTVDEVMQLAKDLSGFFPLMNPSKT